MGPGPHQTNLGACQVAVDRDGQVIAELGYDQVAGNDEFELGGYPAVNDALHGWLRDDVWLLGSKMYVVVEPNAVDFAVPDREGNFSLQVPPGEYTLKAYFDGKATGKPQEGVNVGGRDIDLREPLGLGGT